MNHREAYQYGIAFLSECGIEDARTDTVLLLETFCHIAIGDIYAHGEEAIPDENMQRYCEALEKRSRHIPLQYLTGYQNFMGIDFTVNEHVLIPRLDTEFLVEEVLRKMQDGYRILDLCTGSGCILLSILSYTNGCIGVGTDLSGEALEVARENAKRLLLQAEFVQSDLFEGVRGTFDRIVSNPPYIRRDVIPSLMEEVREHEPLLALDGGEDGLRFYREIITKSPLYLNGGGMLFLEIGHDQGKSVHSMMIKQGFEQVQIKKDYAGCDRVVYGTWFGGNRDV